LFVLRWFVVRRSLFGLQPASEIIVTPVTAVIEATSEPPQRPPCETHHRRNLSVPEAPQLVHPSGHPISHSTHLGFSPPPATAFSGGVFRSICEGPPLLLASCAVGVGKIATAVAREIPVPLRSSFAKSGPAADAFGVGQSL
jgi:hypothetical protein